MTNRILDDERYSGGLVGYFARHRVAANLFMILLIILGIGAVFSLKTQFFPDIESNRFTVEVMWPGASAENVETQITTPLESRIKQLKGVDSYESRSANGISHIWVNYLQSADMTEAEQKLTSLVEGYSDFPDNAEKPNVTREDYSEMTSVVVISSDGTVDQLEPFVDAYKAQLLSMGIAKIETNGLLKTQIQVEVPTEQLLGLKTNIGQLAGKINQLNQDHSAGTVGESFSEKTIQTRNQKIAPNEISQLIIQADQNGHFTTLNEIASINRVEVPGTTKVYWEDKPSVSMFLFRDETIDTIETNDILNQWLEETNANLPPGISVEVPYRVSDFVIGNMKLLINNGLLGLLLVTLMLFVFLNGRVAFWTALGIPVSILGTLFILQLTGGSINFLSMFGMLMALGIIVDDAIVVGEEAVTQLEQGHGPSAAARRGATRMFGPVLASSLTTIAAFSPLLFLDGIQGELFRPIPVVVISVIIASLIEVFLIMPGHLNHSFQRAEKANKKPTKFRTTIDHHLFSFRDGPYRALVTKAVNNRAITLAITIAIGMLSVGLVLSNNVRFVGDPNPEDAVVTAQANFAEGTTEQQIRQFADEMERGLYAATDEFERSDQLVVNKYIQYSTDDRYIWMRVTLLPRDDRPFSNSEFLDVWDKHVRRDVFVDDIEISQAQSNSATAQTLSFFLVADDLDTLRKASTELKESLTYYPDLKNIRDNIPLGDEEILFHLTPTAEAIGITAADISSQVRAAVDGVKVQTFTEKNSQVDLVISLTEADKNNPDVLRYLPITTPSQTIVPLGNLIDLTTNTAVNRIFHRNGQVGIGVYASILNPDADLSKIAASVEKNELKQVMDKYNLTSEIQGSNRELQQTLKELSIKAVIALLIMYIILAWVFSSYSWPIAVMSAIPLGLTGAIFGHWVMGFDMNVLSIFGFFGLAGIIVNDSIILISRYRELIGEGFEKKEAIINASCQRFRAVILTSITTVVGLVPILFETSVQAQLVQSMATSLAFGLAYGTVLVLIVVPVILSIIESTKARGGQAKRWAMQRAFGKPAVVES